MASALYHSRPMMVSSWSTWTAVSTRKPARSGTGRVKLVEAADSYTEISPSGTGLKIYARAPRGLRFPVKTINIPDAPRLSAKDRAIEILCEGRYTTVTGDHFGGTPPRIEEAGGFLRNMAADRASVERERRQPLVTPWTVELLLRAADVIPNDTKGWPLWKERAMRFWAATDGSEDGFAAFDTFSQKCPDYNAALARKCWGEVDRSPPTAYNVRSLLIEARKYDRDFPDPADLIGADADISGVLGKMNGAKPGGETKEAPKAESGVAPHHPPGGLRRRAVHGPAAADRVADRGQHPARRAGAACQPGRRREVLQVDGGVLPGCHPAERQPCAQPPGARRARRRARARRLHHQRG